MKDARQEIFARKQAARERAARLPVVKKLETIDRLRERQIELTRYRSEASSQKKAPSA